MNLFPYGGLRLCPGNRSQSMQCLKASREGRVFLGSSGIQKKVTKMSKYLFVLFCVFLGVAVSVFFYMMFLWFCLFVCFAGLVS